MVHKRANLAQSIAALEREAALLEQKIKVEQGLLDDGLITKQTLLDTQQKLNCHQRSARRAPAGERQPST